MTTEMRELRVSNDAIADREELRRRMNDEGYVFIKKLQDPERLSQLRKDIMTVLQKGGWLVAGTDPMEGIADPAARCTEGDLPYTDVYHSMYRLQIFHESGHWPEIMDVIGPQ